MTDQDTTSDVTSTTQSILCFIFTFITKFEYLFDFLKSLILSVTVVAEIIYDAIIATDPPFTVDLAMVQYAVSTMQSPTALFGYQFRICDCCSDDTTFAGNFIFFGFAPSVLHGPISYNVDLY